MRRWKAAVSGPTCLTAGPYQGTGARPRMDESVQFAPARHSSDRPPEYARCGDSLSSAESLANGALEVSAAHSKICAPMTADDGRA